MAYAITRSFEEAEQVIAEVSVALMTAESLRAMRRLNPAEDVGSVSHKLKFAHSVYELASKKAFRLLTDETFFRLSPIARAICILKMNARFSNEHIATIVGIEETQVDLHLENARKLFSNGRSWTDSEVFDCPYWKSTTPYGDSIIQEDVQSLFAQYIEEDLPKNVSAAMNEHFNVCVSCRNNLAHFKKMHADFAASVPHVNPSKSMDKVLPKFLSQTTQMILDPRPTFIGSLNGLARDRGFQYGIAGLALAATVARLFFKIN